MKVSRSISEPTRKRPRFHIESPQSSSCSCSCSSKMSNSGKSMPKKKFKVSEQTLITLVLRAADDGKVPCWEEIFQAIRTRSQKFTRSDLVKTINVVNKHHKKFREVMTEKFADQSTALACFAAAESSEMGHNGASSSQMVVSDTYGTSVISDDPMTRCKNTVAAILGVCRLERHVLLNCTKFFSDPVKCSYFLGLEEVEKKCIANALSLEVCPIF